MLKNSFDRPSGPLERDHLLIFSVLLVLSFYFIYFAQEKAKEQLQSYILETKGMIADEGKIIDQAQVELQKAVKASTELRDKVQIIRTDSGLTVDIRAYRLFPMGQTELRIGAEKPVAILAQILRDSAIDHDLFLLVEGHTDDSPVLRANSYFPSNWELSAIRAGTVVRLLRDSGVPQKRLGIAGYGPSRPRHPNIRKNGNPHFRNRDLNRRVVIHLLGRRWFEEFLVSKTDIRAK